MIREKFCFRWQGFMQRIDPIVNLVRSISSQEHLESNSVPPNLAGNAVPTVATSWIKRRQSLSTPWCLFFHDVWINFLGFIVWLISRCCSRRALVERSLRLKWLTMSFPTSIISAILFLNFAGDALQMTPPKAHSASRTFSWRLRLGSLKVNATLLQLCGSRWRSSHKLSPRLARQCGSQENNESKQADQILKSSSTPFAPLVAKARWSVRRKGDWKEIAKLKAKYSSQLL